MRLRTFTAEDMQLAMHMVRESLGEDAIIISTKQLSEAGDVQVTAAFDDMFAEDDASDDNPDNMKWYAALAGEQSPIPRASYPLPNAPSFPQNNRERSDATVPERTAQHIERILIHHGFNDLLIDYLMMRLNGISTSDVNYYKHQQDITARWMTALIATSFPMNPLAVRNDSFRHILIGAPGAGKTLTTAKIAASCVKAGKPVHVITTDNKRAGGVEQLAAITDILGVELMVAESRQSLKAMLSDIALAETVIVDSAGANPYDFYELKALAEYAGLIELDPILIYPSGSDPLEADEVARAFSFIGVEKMIVTRTDTARRFGCIFNAAHAGGLKFANITGSEKILGTFDACTPEYLAQLLMDFQPEEVSKR